MTEFTKGIFNTAGEVYVFDEIGLQNSNTFSFRGGKLVQFLYHANFDQNTKTLSTCSYTLSIDRAKKSKP